MATRSPRQSRSSLDTYRRKRDFRKTSEPAKTPARRAPVRTRARPVALRRFVIQKHAATRLHFDFRLQVGRVLKSWAVPKGPSIDPHDRRLAVEVEDHPLAYGDFEGTIPKGEYGGGTVMLWDTGMYRNMSEENGAPIPMTRALEKGHATIWLEGSKLRGGWTLVRTGRPDPKNWLLIKLADEEADDGVQPVDTLDRSARSGRTMKEIAQDGA